MGNILIMLQLIMKRLSGIQKEFQISNIKIYNWKTFEKSNATSAINILYIKQKEIDPAYISKIDSNCGKKNYINDSKQRKRRMALSCSKNVDYFIKRSNMKTLW